MEIEFTVTSSPEDLKLLRKLLCPSPESSYSKQFILCHGSTLVPRLLLELAFIFLSLCRTGSTPSKSLVRVPSSFFEIPVSLTTSSVSTLSFQPVCL